MENKEILDKIRELKKVNTIVFMTEEGLMTCDIEKIISQPIEGLLYDLNRDDATLATMANSKSLRWVNDMALVNVLKFIYNENINLKKEVEDLKLELGEYMKDPFKDIMMTDKGAGKPIPTNKQKPSIEKTNIGADKVVPGFNTNLSISL